MKHLIIGIQKLNEENLKKVEISIKSIIKASKKVDNNFICVLRDDNKLKKYLDIDNKYFINGDNRSKARNLGLEFMKSFINNNSIIHFIDCDQEIKFNSFYFLEKVYFPINNNNVVGTLRYNLLDNGKIQKDERFDESRFSPHWQHMYTNFLSLNASLIKDVRFNEKFLIWGHEDLLFNYEIWKTNNEQICYSFNKLLCPIHFEHKINTDLGIENLKIIQKLYPELKEWINNKIIKLQKEKRSGF